MLREKRVIINGKGVLLSKLVTLGETHEAGICLQLPPQLKVAAKLMANFLAHPSAINEEIESP